MSQKLVEKIDKWSFSLEKEAVENTKIIGFRNDQLLRSAIKEIRRLKRLNRQIRKD